ncbi:Alpha/Beta hydrolase protein [Lophiotrema nucula]|uniref:triacylglycerol lipase n=1 Tax=Lophiotrema nucula TaxID=690887 RepID=A0A6A5YGW2_9PLEO|nr:Alpha/Beta hydrolase protein [Lophiotrema nucula]
MPVNGLWNFFTRLLFFFVLLIPAALVVLRLSASAGSYDAAAYLPLQASAASHQRPCLNAQSASQHEGLVLRHVFQHGAGQPGPRARRLDISVERVAQAGAGSHLGPFPIKTTAVRIDKPALKDYGSQMPMSSYWITNEIPGPNITDKNTTINLAWMSEDAYKPDRWDPEWVDIGDTYNQSIPFGWDDNGIRGHVFLDDTNSTIILSIKGTSVTVFEGNGTSTRDKENDNLFGSCCCGQGGSYLWRTVCDCQTGTFTCDEKCVKKELQEKNKYYAATLELYDEVVQMYPRASIMTVGHSLGGVLASLIGLRHGIPSVTFEAYPQALAAARLGLPIAGDLSPLRRNTGGFHFGHTADPVYMGTCNSASSFCSIAGFAFETLCHTGKRCAYDVVKDWGWRQSTNTHRLRYAIENVYEKYNESATCEDEAVDCVDCYLWKFENGTKSTTTTTTTSTATTRTRTETCKTPGWWGCLDETTTTAESTSTSTTTATTSTSTCRTPGWFGCKDKTTTTTTTTPSSSTSETTTTCTSKGWFGRCLDETGTTTTTSADSSPTPPAPTTCSSKGWFGRCLDKPTVVASRTAEAAYWRTVPTATQTPY